VTSNLLQISGEGDLAVSEDETASDRAGPDPSGMVRAATRKVPPFLHVKGVARQLEGALAPPG
jgi:hypothetical protein